MFHGRMQLGREQKADPHLIDAFADLLRRQVQVDAQLVEHVGAAAFAAGGAVAVLGDLQSRARRHKSDRRADVERPRLIAAGAAGIQQQIGVGFGRDAVGIGAHRPRAADDLVLRLALHAQRHQVRADLRLGRAARHDLVHDRFGFILLQMPEAADHVDCFLNVH